MENGIFPKVGPCAIQAVLLVDLLGPRPGGYRFRSSSLPGHLIQCVVSGRTRHDANGRQYDLAPGSVIWYHEDELVRGEVLDGPWRFYTLNFVAPALSPPPFESRVRSVEPATVQLFQQILDAWRDAQASPAVREMRVQSYLLELLATLWSHAAQPFRMDPSARLWWDLETTLRQDLRQPINLSMMEDLTGKSQATIARSCLDAVGAPPMKRVKQIRMSLARGLVLRSDLNISQVADRVGYARVHEFSRDYRKHFGVSPSADRSAP